MVHVVIPHIVGTVALITIFFIAGLYYNYVYSSLQTDVTTKKLKEVADYVASNIMDLISLCYLSSGDQSLNKTVTVPESIGNNIYTIAIANFSDPAAGEVLYVVRAYLTLSPSVYGESELPWTSGGGIRVDSSASSISAGVGSFIIWCRKTGDTITVGFSMEG